MGRVGEHDGPFVDGQRARRPLRERHLPAWLGLGGSRIDRNELPFEREDHQIADRGGWKERNARKPPLATANRWSFARVHRGGRRVA